MVVAIRRRHRGIGDDISDALAGSDSAGLVSEGPQTVTSAPSDSLLVPEFAKSSSSAPPVGTTAAGNNSSAWDWTSIGKFASGLFGIAGPKPVAIVKPASSASSTAIVVGGVALGAVALVLLLRSRPA